MKEKKASNVSIIGEADGPTSVFILGKKKPTVRQKIQKKRFQLKKLWNEKRITAENHPLEDVCKYITAHYGFKEVSSHSGEYKEEYIQMRASFIMQYAPELLGEFAQMPELSSHDEGEIKRFMEQIELRQQAAENIPIDCFDIDFHKYKKEFGHMQMHFIVELKYGYIGGGVSGSKDNTKQFEKIYRDVYRYYGVTKDDIEHKTRRYDALVSTLARK